MAAHHIAIAKASLAASLLRPDPTPVPRDEITRFHALLESALTQCSPPNVQACTKWLLGNITPSSGRIKTLGKYLTALSASFVTLDGGRSGAQAQALPKEKTRSKRRGLHILYVVNDLLHATKYHGTAPYAHTSLTSNLQPHLMDLVGSAASCELSKNGKIHQRIAELLDHWERKGYYVQEYCKKMHIAASASRAAPHGSSSTEAGGQGAAAPSGNTASKGKDAPFVMPATHGDRSIPWYDLPAGNMMPHMVPNSPIPINTRIMQPLQFTAGPADEKLVSAVKDLLKEVESIYDSTHQLDEGIVADIDEMGQPMILDADSGELVPGNGYYGWTGAKSQWKSQQKLQSAEAQEIQLVHQQQKPKRDPAQIWRPESVPLTFHACFGKIIQEERRYQIKVTKPCEIFVQIQPTATSVPQPPQSIEIQK
ncbi:hypothetical protein LTR04_003450 [Oleoguttula sp. CCFEE 6159]|nr:hypothetical protein LTR04_003450 [Oleoguttula sp. CCFEE 6159]